MTTQVTVIHHSADMDGIFCREIARKFIPAATLVGWDFGNDPVPIPPTGKVFVLDLPVDRMFGFDFNKPETVILKFQDVHAMKEFNERLVWIDHHKSSIESHPTDIPGYRIDGVAACRLAWQWFANLFALSPVTSFPTKEDFVERRVEEPLAVRLAGEYDIWDKRDPRAETFQFGLRSQEIDPVSWEHLLSEDSETPVHTLLNQGALLQTYQQRNDAGMMHRSFLVEFEGLKFLALTSARCNSLTFASKDVPETGHDALMGFYFDGKKWTVSLYHAKHRTDLDLSKIAVKYSGGGHRGACGFQIEKLPFL